MVTSRAIFSLDPSATDLQRFPEAPHQSPPSCPQSFTEVVSVRKIGCHASSVTSAWACGPEPGPSSCRACARGREHGTQDHLSRRWRSLRSVRIRVDFDCQYLQGFRGKWAYRGSRRWTDRVRNSCPTPSRGDWTSLASCWVRPGTLRTPRCRRGDFLGRGGCRRSEVRSQGTDPSMGWPSCGAEPGHPDCLAHRGMRQGDRRGAPAHSCGARPSLTEHQSLQRGQPSSPGADRRRSRAKGQTGRGSGPRRQRHERP